MALARDDGDRLRFVKSLYYLNDSHSDPYLHETIADLPLFERPPDWPEHDPLVRILAWTLLSNHFHLLLQEIREGGIARFMQGLGGSMTKCYNLKYKERGSIFQSLYHGKVIDEDAHLTYLGFYILVKNVLEMYPGGLREAQKNFDDAWAWAVQYPWSSFSGHISGSHTPIIEVSDNPLVDIMGCGDECKHQARELLDLHIDSHGEEYKDLMLEFW